MIARLPMKYSHVIVVGMVLAGLLAACNGGPGGSGGLPPERPAGVVSGYAIDGAIVGGTVRVFAWAGGARGALLGETVTDAHGAYALDLRAVDQPVLIEVSGGRYVEHASGLPVALQEGQVMRTVALYTSGRPLTAMVTPLTHVAAGLAEFRVAQGVDAAQAVTASAADVAAAFGVDVTGTRPRDIADGGAVTASADENYYGFLLAGLSSWTRWAAAQNGDAAQAVYTAIGLCQILYNDIVADGALDGVGRQRPGDALTPLAVGAVPLDRDVYRISFAQHLLAMTDNERNATGLSASDLRERALALATTANAVFDAGAVARGPLPPKVFAVDPEGFYYNGVMTYRVVIGGSGVAQQVVFDIDGIVIGATADVTRPSIDIDTRAYADGEYRIGVAADDGLGNAVYQQFRVRFDNTVPFVNVTSAPVANQTSFTVTGTFGDNGAGVAAITVQERPAALSVDGAWQAQVELAPGNNVIAIRVRDRAGNAHQTETTVGLDTVAPVISAAGRHSQAAFSNGDGTFVVAPLQDANDAAPLYIETDRVDLAGTAVTRAALDARGIAYFGFEVADPDSAGVATAAAQLAVRLRYEKNGDTTAAWRPLPALASGKDYLVALAGEVLGDAWVASTPGDHHVIRVRVTDRAGNHGDAVFAFRADFYPPAPAVTRVDDVAQAVFTGTAFSQRAALNGATIAANAYVFTNGASRAVHIRLEDTATHTATQNVEQMVRENLARLETRTQWRAGFVVNALAECPQPDDWRLINEIFNFRDGAWQTRTSPPPSVGDPVFVTSDDPAAPAPGAWQPVADFDNDFAAFSLATPPVTLTYQYDYVANLSPSGQTRPALIRNWRQTGALASGDTTCPDVRAFDQRLEYRYRSETGYPRNVLSTFIEQTGFASSGYRVQDRSAGDADVEPFQGWYRVPPGHTVVITKRVTLPVLTIYSDADVLNPGAFSSYTPRRHDKSVVWAIGRHVRITSVHDTGQDNVFAMSSRARDAGTGVQEYQLAR